jgi:predicted house-cleaning noncanonical NTP pyrophosphatase (MazG superfamily)
MQYNKLVRDKIPEILKKRGQIPVTRVANKKESMDFLNSIKE